MTDKQADTFRDQQTAMTDNSDIEEVAQYAGLVVGPRIRARYDGPCAVCDQTIAVKDSIAAVFIESQTTSLGFGCPRCLARITAARAAQILGRL